MFVGEVLNFCERVGGIVDNPIKNFVIDSRLVTQGDCFICFKGKNTDGHKFIEDAILKGASLIVASDPDEASKFRNRTNIVLCKDPVHFLQQCAQYRRKRLNATFVTITGAVGKTTTKEFTRNLLGQKFSVFATPKNENNLLGVSLSLLNMPLTTQIAIIETGTNHFGEVGELTKLVKPHGTITTAIAPSHLEFFKTTEGVLLAETEQISWFQNRSGFWCINFDDKFLRKLLNLKSKAKFKTFALRNRKADLYFENINQAVNFKLGYQFKLNLFSKKFDFPYFGLFNLQNLLGAFSLCLEFLSSKDLENIYDPQILKFPDFRSQVFNAGEKIFIIDCYNANPGSFKTAIREVAKLRVNLYKDHSLFGIFADMAELGSKAKFYHLKLAQLAAKTHFERILYLGDYCDIFKQALGKKVLCFSSDSQLFSAISRQLRSRKKLIVLVKGSHKFALERVIKYLENSH